MKSVRLAILALAGCTWAAGAVAAQECHWNVCSNSTATRTETGWKANLKLGITAAHYHFMNVRILGQPQMEVDGPGNNVDLNFDLPPNWDGTFGAQACIEDPLSSRCDDWRTFQVDLPLAADDQSFCVRYAGHAVSAATVAQQKNCNFETASGRWSTDNALHLNWCVSLFKQAGFDAGQLGAMRNAVNAEDASRTSMLAACQPPCPGDQIRFDGQCVDHLPVLPGTSTGAGGGFIQMFPTCPAGKKLDVAQRTCVDDAPPPAPATPEPAPATPAPSGSMTASTCSLSGTATVVIADPSLTSLNVRDRPNGPTVITTIPENSQVNVVGACGSTLSAGIVAPTVIPGWCAISAPVTGCVKEEFLVAGTPAAAPASAPGTAGLVAAQPSFTGTWAAEAQGYNYTFTLNQAGGTVTGNYTGTDGSSGQLSGNVSGDVLRFGWQQADGVSGAGKFTLSADGNAFNGSYTLSNDPEVVEGSWNGRRQ